MSETEALVADILNTDVDESLAAVLNTVESPIPSPVRGGSEIPAVDAPSNAKYFATARELLGLTPENSSSSNKKSASLRGDSMSLVVAEPSIEVGEIPPSLALKSASPLGKSSAKGKGGVPIFKRRRRVIKLGSASSAQTSARLDPKSPTLPPNSGEEFEEPAPIQVVEAERPIDESERPKKRKHPKHAKDSREGSTPIPPIHETGGRGKKHFPFAEGSRAFQL